MIPMALSGLNYSLRELIRGGAYLCFSTCTRKSNCNKLYVDSEELFSLT